MPDESRSPEPGAPSGRGAPSSGPPAALERAGRLAGLHLGGRYELSAAVGETALALLFAGRDLERGSGVLVHVLHGFVASAPGSAERLPEAFDAALRSSSTHGVTVVDHGLERVEGEWIAYLVARPHPLTPLVEALRQDGLFTLDESLSIVVAVLRALDAAHAAGITHGAVSSKSVLVQTGADSPDARLADFGVGRVALELTAPLGYGPFLGPAAAAAPEIEAGAAPTPASDVFSTGCLLYELLTGAPPSTSWSPAERSRRRRTTTPTAPSKRLPERGIGAATDRAVLRALAPDPDARFPSAAAMIEALESAREIDASAAAAPDEAGWELDAPITIGREDERGRLYGLARRTLDAGRGAAVLVLGPAGLGKSRLAEAVGFDVSAGPFQVVRVDGRAAAAEPFGPFIEMLRAALGAGRGAGLGALDGARTRLAALGVTGHDAERVLDALAARAAPIAIDPALAHRETSTALATTLRALLARCPALLVVDDADALEPAARRLAADLLATASARPILVVVTARYDPWPEWKPSHAERVELEALPEDALVAIAEAELEAMGAESEASVAMSAARLAQGVPWLAALAARAAACGRAALLQGAPSPVDLVRAVLDSTEPTARRWLGGAALFGNRVPLGALDAWCPTGDRDAVVATCERSRLVRVEDADLVFECEGTRQALLELFPSKEARAARLDFVRWLSGGDPPRAETAAVAELLFAAGDAVGAAARYEAAGRRTLARGDGPSALVLLSAARAAWRHGADALGDARAELLVAEAQVECRDLRAAGETLERARRALRSAQPDVPRADVVALDLLARRVEGRLKRRAGDPEAAVRVLEAAIGVAAPSGDAGAWYEVEHELVSILSELGRPDDAHEHALVAVEVARTLDKSVRSDDAGNRRAAVADALSQLGRVELARGNPAGALVAFRGAAEESAGAGDMAGGARDLANLAHAHAAEGRLDDALREALAALALADRIGDRDAMARISFAEGNYRARSGDAAGARDAYHRCRELARAIGWLDGARLAQDAAARLPR